MPKGVNKLELKGYYSGKDILKSIQLSYKFYVTFLDNAIRNRKLISEIGMMPFIKNWHVLNVSIPTYVFKKESQKYGPMVKTIPVIDHDGFDIKITFEEDSYGTIAYFINWLQRKIVRQDGMYRNQVDNRIDNLNIEIEDERGVPVGFFNFRDVYYLASGEVTYDYSTNESIKYEVTFGADYVSTLPVKSPDANIARVTTAIGLGQKAARKTLGGFAKC